MAEPVHIYDTTLRDGMQREGISLSVSEKLQVAHLLDRLGCAYIEAGFPASNPKDWELFEQLEQETFQTARVAAFGMTRRKDIRASDDEALRVLVECFAPVITLVGKTWDLHLDKVVRVSREENLAMIGDSVRFCVEQGKEVVYDAEHFFDGYAADRDYALRCLRTAAEAGASNVTMCDTNGATLPAQVAAAVADVHAALGGDVALGIHTHNDAECAVANSVAAVEAGARLVQGTLNGYGERCGNANLIAIIPSLEIKLGYALHRPGAPGAAEPDLARGGRDLQPAARRPRRIRRPQRVRAQGRHARRRHAGRRAHLRAHRPGRRRQHAARCWCRSCPARGRCARRRPSSASSSTPRASTARWSA